MLVRLAILAIVLGLFVGAEPFSLRDPESMRTPQSLRMLGSKLAPSALVNRYMSAQRRVKLLMKHPRGNIRLLGTSDVIKRKTGGQLWWYCASLGWKRTPEETLRCVEMLSKAIKSP